MDVEGKLDMDRSLIDIYNDLTDEVIRLSDYDQININSPGLALFFKEKGLYVREDDGGFWIAMEITKEMDRDDWTHRSDGL